MPYWRRRSRNYGRERASRHVAEARAFSYEVAGTDDLVKQTFFSLSGRALKHLLDQYGARYGASARAWAEQTIPKWRSGKVQMSGMVAKRLFDLLPPFMPAADKNRIIESIWRLKGPRSRSFLYVGPDSDPYKVALALEVYFDHLEVQYPLPEDLRAQFKWLSQDDASAQERMLNHFMAKQRELAFQSARLHLPLLIESIKGDPQGQIERLTHTISVGNHVVEIRADRYRTGFAFSSSPSYTPPPFRMTPASWATLAAIIGVLVAIVLWNSRGTLDEPPTPVTVAAAQPIQTEPSINPAHLHTGPPPVMRHVATPARLPQIAAPARQNIPPYHPHAVHPQVLHYQRAISTDGCSDHAIAWSEPDGSAVVTSEGERYSISDDLQRIIATQWTTGQPVSVCSHGTLATLQHDFETVHAVHAGQVSVQDGTCRRLYVGFAAADGTTVTTTDGSTFAVGNGLQQIIAAQWITGDATTACTMRVGATWRASLARDGERIEVTLRSIGTGRTSAPACSNKSLATQGGQDLRLADGTYHIDNGLMRILAQQFPPQSRAIICHFTDGGVRHIGVARNGMRIEAERSL